MDLKPEEKWRLERRSGKTTAIGFVVSFVGSFAFQGDGNAQIPLFVALLATWVVGISIFLWGCCDLARAKGYPWQIGFIGITFCVGYLILYYILPDKWQEERLRRNDAQVTEHGYTRDPNCL